MSDEKPEPLTLALVIECEDGEYFAHIAGSYIYGDGKTPAAAVASVAAALAGVEGYQAEQMLRRYAHAAKDEQREQDAAVLEQTNAGYAALREREQKHRRLREAVRAAVGDKVDALASEIERTLKVRHNKAKRATK